MGSGQYKRDIARARTFGFTKDVEMMRTRGLGLGGRLVDECISFARSKGYRKLMLWTNSCLLEARALYAKRGFVLTASEPYHGFGQSLVGETWELKL